MTPELLEEYKAALTVEARLAVLERACAPTLVGVADGIRDVRYGAGNAGRPVGRKTYQPLPERKPARIVNGGTNRARRYVPRQLSTSEDEVWANHYWAGVAVARSLGLGEVKAGPVPVGPRAAFEARRGHDIFVRESGATAETVIVPTPWEALYLLEGRSPGLGRRLCAIHLWAKVRKRKRREAKEASGPVAVGAPPKVADLDKLNASIRAHVASKARR